MTIFEGALKLEKIEDVARETKKFIFSVANAHPLDHPEKIGNFSFLAGQFLSLKFTETAWRAYSIASSPYEKHIEFIVRYVADGTASNIWWHAKKGDLFPFKGPFGKFLLSPHAEAKLVFCGTGTGIAPLRSLILTENTRKNPRPMTLLYGGRDKDDLAYLDEISTWSSHLKISLGFSRALPTKKLRMESQLCRITKFLEESVWNEHHEFYICGNGDMVKSVMELLKSKGISGGKIFMERFN
jgi:CDP-4-dehydro-6-deoxyglucose reductase